MGRGIALKIAATLAFAVMNALIKATTARFSVAEVVLFRSVFALVVLVLWLWRRDEFPHVLKTDRPLGHIGRSLAGSGGMAANFLVLALLPLADATAFTFVTPLLVAPLAAALLGEIVRPYRWAAVIAGFAGVLVMLSEKLGADAGERASQGVAIALIGALFSAAAMIQTRRLTLSEPTGAIVFYFSSVTAALAAFALIVFSLWPSGIAGADFAAGQGWATPPARRIFRARRDRRTRRRRPDPDDPQLPIRRRLHHRSVRLCRDDLGGRARNDVLRRNADDEGGARRRDRRPCRAFRALARAASEKDRNWAQPGFGPSSRRNAKITISVINPPTIASDRK